ncbi:class I adenylate-forming enzyme family protein [Sporosarcina soli]|uniref:Class I adenylate-forming enzyme family protein n=1 Tax=Sporosarcina soli TaxID=334736 RepID=A0ABW0TP27_9BACL
MLVRGDSVIRGYLDKENNNGAFLDGWPKTGDLGYLDEKNYLHYVGRSKEMYISGGYYVYPLEIESFLNAYPSVNASCIIEVPDETWGEVGVAFIVPEDGVTLDADEQLLYCKNGLADYKRPRKYFIRKDLTNISVGKIAKQEIRGNLASFLSELRGMFSFIVSNNSKIQQPDDFVCQAVVFFFIHPLPHN